MCTSASLPSTAVLHVVALEPERARDGFAYVLVVFDDEHPVSQLRTARPGSHSVSLAYCE